MLTDLFAPQKSSAPQNIETSDEAMEYLIAAKTGWSFEYIRNLSVRDFEIMYVAATREEKIKGEINMAKLNMPM